LYSTLPTKQRPEPVFPRLRRWLSRQALTNWLPVIFLVMVFGLLFFKLLSSHMLLAKPDGWYSAGATWADLGWHLSMLSNFAERGLSAVREDPIFPGTKLSYPFLPDLLSAGLVRCGFSVQRSLIAPALLVILAFVIALYFFARRMAGTFGAMATPFLLLFNGSIVGCYYLWRDSQIPHSLGSTLFSPNVDYSHLREHNIEFSNLVSEYILPQRAAEFGLFLGILAVQFLWLYWDTRKPKYLVYASLVLSGMPYVHFHSFVALVIVAGFLFCIQFLADPGYWSVIRDWLSFAVSLIVLALPQVVWISPVHAGHFLHVQWGWMRGNEPLWLFWLKNLSPHLLVFALAYWMAKPKLKTFYLAFVGLFVVSNILVFQPNDWDNIKLFVWWFLLSCVLVGSFLDQLWQRHSWRGALIAVLLFALMTATGAASVYRELHLSWLMFSREDLELADFVRAHTRKDALFLTSDKHNNPVACLGGRRILMGYRGWLWSHGIDYHPREQDIRAIYSGSERATDLLMRYGIDYVLIEQDKVADFHENVGFFSARFLPVYRSPHYILFDAAK
jgi:hypothetical protein